MFICKANLFIPIQKMNIKINNFDIPDNTHQTSTISHAFERLFGLIITAQNYKIKDTITKHKYINIIINKLHKIISFIFNAKINSKGIFKIKIFKIPVYSKRIK